jgi:hypothetical protein
MLTNNKLSRAAVVAALLWAAAGRALCGESDAVDYKFQYYTDNNDVRVYSNAATATKKLGDKWSASVSYLVDAISGASRRDIRGWIRDTTGTAKPGTDAVTSASVMDGITSASPTAEQRHQVSGTLSFTNDYIKAFSTDKNSDDPTTLSITGINSQEADYTSRTVSLALSQDLFQRNTTISARAGKSFDHYSPVSRFVPAALTDPGWNYLGNGERQTDNVSLGITQGITVTTIATVNLGYVSDRGYLGRPYYVYKINDQYRHELVPDRKKSFTISGMLNQYIPLGSGMSLHGEYRYYADSWELTSHTAGIEVSVRLGDYFIVRPSYRYYVQSGTFFYKDFYDSTDYYLTTDFKYREGRSQSGGLKLSWELRDFVKPEKAASFALYPVAIDIGADYYWRSGPHDPAVIRNHYSYFTGDFQTVWIQTGIRFAF